MSAITFTMQELKRAYRQLACTSKAAGGSPRENPHRLLLLYAVECGLKAVLLKRESRSEFTSDDVTSYGHDLRKLAKELRMGANLSLPQQLQLRPLQPDDRQRKGDISILHQAWRYGGQCSSPTDDECETMLNDVLTWIQRELK